MVVKALLTTMLVDVDFSLVDVQDQWMYEFLEELIECLISHKESREMLQN